MRNWQKTLAIWSAITASAPLGAAAAAPQGVADPSAAVATGRLAISTYDDDPFVRPARVESFDARGFKQSPGGHRALNTERIAVQEEPYIFRFDQAGDVHRFAWNPWPCPPFPGDPLACSSPEANAAGDFAFPGDARFPSLVIVRGSDGKPILENGMQRWEPQTSHLGMTTAFDAAAETLAAAEEWSGRRLAWGTRNPDNGPVGQLLINAHAYIDFNAFYSPSARSIFFGLFPYRLPGADPLDIHLFETSTSFDIAAHESGHAVHDVLKPNLSDADLPSRVWGESLGDQMAMWVSLRDPRRARALLAEVDGNLLSSNSLSRLVDAFGVLVGGTGLRDAFHDKTVSTTSPEVHDRSEVLTGALYRIFAAVDADLLSQGMPPVQALQQAGRTMGLFAMRAADFTPENAAGLEEVAKACLKVDKELFGGRYRDRLTAEFVRREIFRSGALAAWKAHEAAVPRLHLPFGLDRDAFDPWVTAHLDELGIGPGFGLRVQQVVRDRGFGETIVRVQLTEGRDSGATGLGNFGILVFRADGSLADYHEPLDGQPGSAPGERPAFAASTALVARDVLAAARASGLDQHSAPVRLVRRIDGSLGAQVEVLGGEGLESWVDVFSPEHPEGRRVDVRHFLF